MFLKIDFTELLNVAILYAPKIILAIIALIIGLWFINRITNLLSKAMEKGKLDKDVRPFLTSLLSVLLKVMLLFSIAGMVGVETTSFVAVLAAAGFAIGLALQGSLSNFASGVMILIFKPYRVGDLINAQDQLGHVNEIQIFNTIITTLDNKQVIIPNAQAISGTITNLTSLPYLRVDCNVYIPYEQDFAEAQRIALAALTSVPNTLDTPSPYVEIESFDTHNIKLCARTHSTVEDYWAVYFGANRALKEAFSKANIKINYAEGMTTGNY